MGVIKNPTKLLFLLSVTALIIVIVLWRNCKITVVKVNRPHCFADDRRNCGEDDALKLLLPEKDPPGNDNIFFIEGFGNDYITPRMWCAIESAAMLHSNVPIYVMMTSSYIFMTPVMEKVLKLRSNIEIVHINITTLFQDTPLSDWYKFEKWSSSKWPENHFHDILRLIVLWKFGGIYLDMDVVVMNNLRTFQNFSGLESAKWVAVGVTGFRKRHPIVQECLEIIKSKFDVSEWGSLGPILLTNVLLERCGMQLPSGMCKRCPDVHVYNTKAFYPIPWWKWKDYLNESQPINQSKEIFEEPQTLAIHVWNTFSKTQHVHLNSTALYAIAANKFCPAVVDELQTVF